MLHNTTVQHRTKQETYRQVFRRRRSNTNNLHFSKPQNLSEPLGDWCYPTHRQHVWAGKASYYTIRLCNIQSNKRRTDRSSHGEDPTHIITTSPNRKTFPSHLAIGATQHIDNMCGLEKHRITQYDCATSNQTRGVPTGLPTEKIQHILSPPLQTAKPFRATWRLVLPNT